MKRLLLVLLFALTPALLNAQSQSPPRHALRVGIGIDIGSFYSVGPSMSIDYQYALSDYFDLNINTHFTNFHFNRPNNNLPEDIRHYSSSLRLMFTPFPQWFRYFQIGIGPGVWFGGHSYGKRALDIVMPIEFTRDGVVSYPIEYYEYRRRNYISWEIELPIRLYIIDSYKYQLFFDGVFSILHRYDRIPYFIWGSTRVGINFGVKF